MAISNAPWDGSASRFADTAAYCASCLIDLNPPGTPPSKKTQANCKLPVKEPNGAINKNALGPAAAALAGARGGVTGVPPAAKAAAARKLLGYYRQAKMEPPESTTRIAGR